MLSSASSIFGLYIPVYDMQVADTYTVVHDAVKVRMGCYSTYTFEVMSNQPDTFIRFQRILQRQPSFPTVWTLNYDSMQSDMLFCDRLVIQVAL